MSEPLFEIFKAQKDLLLFRPIAPNLREHWSHYVAYVICVSLLVGAGRYWDHPAAEIWQYLGLGSLAYVFALSALLYWLLMPLRPANWTYLSVFLFVGLTSLPALLYAIPVERFFPLEVAQSANVWFLLVVAVWRVALYVKFLRGAAGFDWFRTFVATLLPLSIIVASLAVLNLEHVVFDLMSGIRPEDRSPNDSAYSIVFMMTLFAYVAFPVTALCYLIAVYRAFKAKYRVIQ